MRIEKVAVYRVNGQDFATAKKAQDYVEGLINKVVQEALGERMGVSECIRITNAILNNRERLSILLNCLNDRQENEGDE